MTDSAQPYRRLSGLKPEALMAQGMMPPLAPQADLPGIEIETELGRGGMGMVYLGRQISLNREVAVKVLADELVDDPGFFDRLEREARLMAQLRHPNIVTVHDLLRTTGGSAAIVMEFVEGGSLRELLQRHPNGLPLKQALQIIKQIAEGLQTAHACGVIHRDMKPENVLIDDAGIARVTDFGLALPLHESSARFTLTGTAVGTVDYMAPEQLKGLEPDVRLDVFALGVVAYELLTGQTPRGSFAPPHRLRRGIPIHISSAIMRALKPQREDRFQSVTEFVTALHAPGILRRLLLVLALSASVGAILAYLREPPTISPPLPGPWRDAIAGVHIIEDVFGGEWTNEDGILTSNEQIAVIRLEKDMPAAYDVRMTFTRLTGIDSVALFLRINGTVGCCDLDAWREGLAGLQNIDGQSLKDGYGFRFPLENGRRYEMLVEVRPDNVRVSVDGVFQKDFDVRGKSLSIPTEWYWNPLERPAALGLGTYMSSTRFEKVTWRAIESLD